MSVLFPLILSSAKKHLLPTPSGELVWHLLLLGRRPVELSVLLSLNSTDSPAVIVKAIMDFVVPEGQRKDLGFYRSEDFLEFMKDCFSKPPNMGQVDKAVAARLAYWRDTERRKTLRVYHVENKLQEMVPDLLKLRREAEQQVTIRLDDPSHKGKTTSSDVKVPLNTNTISSSNPNSNLTADNEDFTSIKKRKSDPSPSPSPSLSPSFSSSSSSSSGEAKCANCGVVSEAVKCLCPTCLGCFQYWPGLPFIRPPQPMEAPWFVIPTNNWRTPLLSSLSPTPPLSLSALTSTPTLPLPLSTLLPCDFPVATATNTTTNTTTNAATTAITTATTNTTNTTTNATDATDATNATTINAITNATTGADFGKPEESQSCSSQLVEHLTVAKGQPLPGGVTFEKMWRVRNDGTRSWPPSTTLKCVGGNMMLLEKAEATVGSLSPGQILVVAAKMQTPREPGGYDSQLRLCYHSKGKEILFGEILPVEIKVVEDPSLTPPPLPVFFHPLPSLSYPSPYEQQIQQLEEMGFVGSRVSELLNKKKGDVTLVVDLLLNDFRSGQE